MRKYLKKEGYKCAISIVLVGAVALTSVNTFANSNSFDALSGNAVISGDAVVSGDAEISGDAVLSGDAEISGDAVVSGDAKSRECSSVGDSYTSSGLGMDDIVVETLDDAKNDALSRPSGSKNAFIADVSQSEGVWGTHNFSQSWLNKAYKIEFGIKINGTCSEVAATILSEYYNRKERCVISSDRKGYQSTWFPYFDKYITIASCLGIYKSSGGTDSDRLCIIFEPFYNMYNKSMEGKKYTSNLSDNVDKLHKKAIPVIGTFVAPNKEAHSMVIAGYYDITVVYRTESNTNYKSTTYRYYAVNNGWDSSCKGDKRIQYIRRSYLKHNITQLRKK